MLALLLHAPNQGFGTANHQAIFALQHPSVRATPNSSFHGSESSTPCRLISAWLSNSVDPTDGNDKKGEYYWKDVADEFNNNRPVPVDTLMT